MNPVDFAATKSLDRHRTGWQSLSNAPPCAGIAHASTSIGLFSRTRGNFGSGLGE
jgi:hypothetical protein